MNPAEAQPKPPDDPEGWMLWIVRKFARHCGGKVTPDEFVDRVFLEFANQPESLTHLAPTVLAEVPPAARGAFDERVADALRPGFRYPIWAFWHGSNTEEQDRLLSERLTARVRAWASALLAAGGAGPPPAGYNAAGGGV